MRFDFLYLAFHNCRCRVWYSPYPTHSETTSAAFNPMDLLLWEFDPDSFLGNAWKEGRRPGPINLPSTWGFSPGTWWLLVAQMGRTSVLPHRGTFSPLPGTGFIPTCLKYLEFDLYVDTSESRLGVVVAPSIHWTPRRGAWQSQD